MSTHEECALILASMRAGLQAIQISKDEVNKLPPVQLPGHVTMNEDSTIGCEEIKSTALVASLCDVSHHSSSSESSEQNHLLHKHPVSPPTSPPQTRKSVRYHIEVSKQEGTMMMNKSPITKESSPPLSPTSVIRISESPPISPPRTSFRRRGSHDVNKITKEDEKPVYNREMFWSVTCMTCQQIIPGLVEFVEHVRVEHPSSNSQLLPPPFSGFSLPMRDMAF